VPQRTPVNRKKIPLPFKLIAVIFYVFLITTCIAVPSARACSSCGFQIMEHALPPSGIWLLLGVLWFLSTSIALSILKVKVKGIPSVVKAFIITVAACIIAAAFTGPIVILLLFLPPFITTIKVFLPSGKRQLDTKTISVLKTIGIIGMTASIFLYFYGRQIVKNRPFEYFLSGYNAGHGYNTLSKLLASDPEALPKLRLIIKNGDTEVLRNALKGLENFGDPAKDVPFLIDRLEQAHTENLDPAIIERIEKSLSTLSGLKLPKGTAAQTWRAEWQKKEIE